MGDLDVYMTIDYPEASTKIYEFIDAYSENLSTLSQIDMRMEELEDAFEHEDSQSSSLKKDNDDKLRDCNREMPGDLKYKLDSQYVSICLFKTFLENEKTKIRDSENKILEMQLNERIKELDQMIKEKADRIQDRFSNHASPDRNEPEQTTLYIKSQDEYATYISDCLPTYINGKTWFTIGKPENGNAEKSQLKPLFDNNSKPDNINNNNNQSNNNQSIINQSINNQSNNNQSINNQSNNNQSIDILSLFEPNTEWANTLPNRGEKEKIVTEFDDNAFKSKKDLLSNSWTSRILLEKSDVNDDNYIPLYSGLSIYRTKILNTLWNDKTDTDIVLPSLFSTSLDINTALRFIQPPEKLSTGEISHVPTLIVFYIPIGNKELDLAPFLKKVNEINLTEKLKTFPDIKSENEILLMCNMSFKVKDIRSGVSLPFKTIKNLNGVRQNIYNLYPNITVYHLVYNS